MQTDNHLSIREREICSDRIEGLSYKVIAVKRGIHISTVKTHLDRIFKKLSVHSSLELQCALKGDKCAGCLRPIAARMKLLAEQSALFNKLLQHWKLE
jgi:DNA-binding CsgD family transcriptional regulator